MNERELFNKIESLKEIKADAEWASLTRDRILGERKLFSFQDILAGFGFRTRAFVAATALILLGSFFYLQFLVSSDQRLAKELERQSKEDEAQMLSILLAELKEARDRMDQDFADLIVTKSDEEAVKISQEIAPLLLEIEEKEGVIMGSLGIVAEHEETPTSEKVVSYLLADLEKRNLTEEDKALFQLAKEAFEAGDYQEALRRILRVGESQEAEV